MLPGSWPEKRAAACEALAKTKLEVAKMGSLCSISEERTCPARTARVSSPHSSALPTTHTPVTKKPAELMR